MSEMRRKQLFWLSLASLAMMMACSDDSSDKPMIFMKNTEPDEIVRALELKSTVGCAIDSDCDSGLFCFHGLCTSECSATLPCAEGVCGTNGRCVKATSGTSTPSGDGGESGAPEGDTTSGAVQEAQPVTEVVERVPGVDVLEPPDARVFVNKGAEYTTVKMVTTQDNGLINYTVRKPSDQTVTHLMTAEPKVDASTGFATYELMLPVKESSLGDDGSVETVIVETSFASYEIMLAPTKATSGLYEGTVAADQFGGVGLPVRFMVKTTPENIQNFEQIEKMELYLPSSGSDLFSPESVTDASKTVWSKVELKKETTNCIKSSPCWGAQYSTNDFVFDKSELISADQKINRALRFEFAGYDRNALMFDGYVRDIMSGVYRETQGTTKQWAKARLEGAFTAKRFGKFDVSDGVEVITHVKAAEKLRDLSAEGPEICTDAALVKLMGFATCAPSQAGCDLSACAELTTLEAFRESEDAQTCLMAAAENLLASDDMVSTIIEGLLTKENQSEAVHGFETLQNFMDDCGKADGICKERAEIVCGVDLLGRSYLTSTDENKTEMLKAWHQLMRESYLGRQYSAWQNDIEVRRKWLTNSDAPSFLASTLEKINTDMLTKWEKDVFEAHRHVLARQFNQTALEVLTRVDSDPEVTSKRDLVLSEYAEAWEGVSDSMSLGIRRYNALYEETLPRTNKAAQLRPYLFDLYYAGLVESAINRSTENGSLNGAYGKSLFENVTLLKSLDQSFDDLVFMRDAELVINTSLDPASSNVLAQRKKLAKDTVAAAQTKRDKVFGDYDTKTINKEEINAMLKNTVDSLQTELVAICGLPRGCTDPNELNCAPRAGFGYCGFNIPYDAVSMGDVDRVLSEVNITQNELNAYYSTKVIGEDIDDCTEEDKTKCRINYIRYVNNIDDLTVDNVYDYYSLTNTGEAAEAIMAYRAAVKDVDIAKADFWALSNKVDIAHQTCEGYARNIEEWNKLRNALIDEIQENVRVINAHYDKISAVESAKLNESVELMKTQYAKQEAAVNAWRELSGEQLETQKKYVYAIMGLNIASLGFELGISAVDRLKETLVTPFSEGSDICIMGNCPGQKATTALGIARTAIVGGSNLLAAALGTAKLATDSVALGLEAAQTVSELEYSFTTELRDRETELELAKLELDFQEQMAYYQEHESQEACDKAVSKLGTNNIKCTLEKICECSGEVDTIYSEVRCPAPQCELKETWYAMGLEQLLLSEQNAIDTLDQVNDTLREFFAVKDAYARDLQDLDFKRAEYLKLSQDLLVKREQVYKAMLQQYAALKHYYSVLQRASMIQQQYDASSERLTKVLNLYSTPATIFAFASDLETVESKIELAKERIYDYLAAVEYYAVRPFVDLRRATYLARSTNDLDAIIDQVDTVVSKCGAGEPNVATVEVSAREMMGITTDFKDMTMGERFRHVLAKGNIPINALTRYTADTTVRDLVKNSTDLRSGTFSVDIKKSMNLATTCNAKIKSFAIKLVGEDLIKEGQGSNVVPTITLFYDGQTQLVSCQPNIQPLVDMIGPKTSYGTYSTFTINASKISPTSKINEYGDPNTTFAGRPFATSYTFLIDPNISENPKINWDNVEDIMFKIEYTYYDVFDRESPCVGL